MTMLPDKAGSRQVGGWRETASRPTAFVSKQPRGAGAGSSPSTARILFVWHLAGEQQGCGALRPPPTVQSVQSQLLGWGSKEEDEYLWVWQSGDNVSLLFLYNNVKVQL